jgi:hypothetical protein
MRRLSSNGKLTAAVIATVLAAGSAAAAVMATGQGNSARQGNATGQGNIAGQGNTGGQGNAAGQSPGQGTSARQGTTTRRTGSRRAAAHRGDLTVAAGYLGLTRTQLHRELRTGKTLAELARGTSGKSVSGLIDALVAAKANRRLVDLRRLVSAEVNRIHAAGPGVRPNLAIAAGYLGLGGAQLRADLRSGRTLAAIADATPGRSHAGLIEALVAATKRRLDARVAAGALTPAQEKARLRRLLRRVQRMVSRPAQNKPVRGAP